MQLKDISAFGLFKIAIAVNLVIPVFQMILLLFVWLFKSEAVIVNDASMKLLGILKFNLDAGPLTWIFFSIIGTVNIFVLSFVEAVLIRLLAFKTAIGKIVVNPKSITELSNFD